MAPSVLSGRICISRRRIGLQAIASDTLGGPRVWPCLFGMGDAMHVMSHAPDGCPALVLNADFRPLSYFPLSLWSWQDALKAVFLDRVDVVAEYETTVRSANFQMRLPSVVSLRKYVNHARTPAFTRFNVFLRDGFACQYCGSAERELLTFDHVIPRSRGGRTTWENIVAACSPCNLKKGGRLPEQAKMRPAQLPVRPTMFELNERGRAFPPNYLHESWQDFLYWDSELLP